MGRNVKDLSHSPLPQNLDPSGQFIMPSSVATLAHIPIFQGNEELENAVKKLLEPIKYIPIVGENSWHGIQGEPAYCKDPFGFVHFRGVLAGGTSGTIAFTLPPEYRPKPNKILLMLQSGGGAGCYVEIPETGKVVLVGPEAKTASFLESISPYLAGS